MISFSILLLFILATINYRVELGAFSFTLMEPIALWIFMTMLISRVQWYKRLSVQKDSMSILFLGLFTWVILIQLFNADFFHGLSDIRDWLIPLLSYIALSTIIKKGWRRWISIFLLIAIFNSLLGLYQHLTDSFRPFVLEAAHFKSLALSDQVFFTSYAVGLFAHPNNFAIYLYLALMISLSWLQQHGKRLMKLLITVLFGVVLFFTYAKTSFIVVFLSIIFWRQLFKSRSKIKLWLVGGVLSIFGPIGAFISFLFLPEGLFTTFWWRVNLWKIALEIIYNNPWILLRGNGLDLFAQIAPYSQPHNVYLYLILQYGIIGLIFTFIIITTIFSKGVFAYRRGLFIHEPLLAGIWTWLLGFFIIGFVESNLGGVESRMIFLIGLACFSGLLEEQRINKLEAIVNDAKVNMSSKLDLNYAKT